MIDIVDVEFDAGFGDIPLERHRAELRQFLIDRGEFRRGAHVIGIFEKDGTADFLGTGQIALGAFLTRLVEHAAVVDLLTIGEYFFNGLGRLGIGPGTGGV